MGDKTENRSSIVCLATTPNPSSPEEGTTLGATLDIDKGRRGLRWVTPLTQPKEGGDNAGCHA